VYEEINIFAGRCGEKKKGFVDKCQYEIVGGIIMGAVEGRWMDGRTTHHKEYKVNEIHRSRSQRFARSHIVVYGRLHQRKEKRARRKRLDVVGWRGKIENVAAART
jgi:hypothetical protein